jgi:hypothetical protein
MSLSNLPGPWRWEQRDESWWRVNDQFHIVTGPYPEPLYQPGDARGTNMTVPAEGDAQHVITRTNVRISNVLQSVFRCTCVWEIGPTSKELGDENATWHLIQVTGAANA